MNGNDFVNFFLRMPFHMFMGCPSCKRTLVCKNISLAAVLIG